MKVFKKHIAVFLFFVLSIPTLIQTIHLFENHNHEHVICSSDIEQHFHENDTVDCSQFHFQLEVYSSEVFTNFKIIPLHYYSENHNEQPQISSVVHPSKNTTRGPPSSLII